LRPAKTKNGDEAASSRTAPGNHAIRVPRHGRQRQKDLVLDQPGHIKLFLQRKEVSGVILQLLLRQVAVAIDKLQQTTQLERVLQRLEATLATQGQHPVHLDQQLWPVALPNSPRDPIHQRAGGIGEQIEQARQQDHLQFPL